MARAKGKGFAGLSAAKTEKLKNTGKNAVLSLGAGFAGASLGAALGKYSFVVSLPIVIFGAYKDSLPIMAGGIGMAFSNVGKSSGSATSGLEGFEGFKEGAKDRVKNYFENFKEKLFLPQKAASHVGELGDPNAYFINPYVRGVGEIDLSQLDKVQAQVAEMSSVQGIEDIDREF